MRDCVGLSVGATNLVAAGPDGTSTVRSAAVAWGDTVLTGFVDRIGDPVPIVAPDGSAHSPDALLVAALTDLMRTVGRPSEGFGLAVPAHWPDRVVDRVRALLPKATVTSDAVAALTAVRSSPGLPTRGVVVLCDFGATGTSITLADASADFRPIGTTARIDDFSGDMIDRTVMAHLLADSDVDPALTSVVHSLNAFRQECRIAKERLSFQSAVGLPGPRVTTVRLTRPELEGLLRDPLDRVLAVLDDVMWRNGIRRSDVAGVATVGGGSRIPLVTQGLSEFLRLPVTTTPRAQSVAAIGAALIAGREPETMTRVAFAPIAAQVPTAAAAVLHGEPTAAASSLAWSVGEPAEPVQYTDDPQFARPEVAFIPEAPGDADEPPALRWFQRPVVLFAAAACAAIVAGAGLVVTADTENTSVASAGPAATQASAPAAAPVNPGPGAQAPAAETVVVTEGPAARQPAAPQRRQAPVAAPSAPQAPAPTPTTAPTTAPTSTTAPTTTTSTPTSTTPSTTAPSTAATSTPPSSAPPSTQTPTATVPPSTVTPTATAPVEAPPASAPPSSATVAPEAPVEVPVLSPEG